MTTIADALKKMQSAETIMDAATTFISSIPQMIRDALAAANQAETDQPLLDLADDLDTHASALQTAMVTTEAGNAAPIGNIPGPSASAAPGADNPAPVPSSTDPNAPQSGVQASDPSNPTIAQSQAGSQTADAAAEASGAKGDASNAARDAEEK